MALFIPFSIDALGGRTVVRWIERAPTPTPLPFVAQMVRERLASGPRRRISGLAALLSAEGQDPVGIVMHLSRCG